LVQTISAAFAWCDKANSIEPGKISMQCNMPIDTAGLELRVLSDAESAARKAAAFVADCARQAIAQRSRFVLAVSGGETPSQMFKRLATEDVPWHDVSIVQVDERIAPSGDPDRNLAGLQGNLLAHIPLPSRQVYPMPVEDRDLSAAAEKYVDILERLCGKPPVFDLVLLGLGSDGHTASLLPGDPVLDVMDADVAVSGVYRGRRRMTLTYPIINRSRRILWLVTGAAKARMLVRLCNGDAHIPAGRINRQGAIVFADSSAAEFLAQKMADM
jgi:6-phosphogluconolactonase